MAQRTIHAMSLTPTARVSRRPQHPFQIRSRPWQIQPCFIAPVLPGETLKNLLLQARVVTDPIKNPLVGWWCEYYIFYVKHRDLSERDEFVEMMLNRAWDPSPVDDVAAVVKHYFYGNGINWVDKCLRRVTEEYFRNQGELWNHATLDGIPLASITGTSWTDSVIASSAFAPPDVVVTNEAGAGTTTVSEIDEALRQYEWVKQNGLTEMSYEDFLRTYGVKIASKEEEHKPELVRFLRDWSYPTNTVEATTGTPSSAVSWAVAERADKDRFFKEPGFLFGVSVVRPKVYLSKQVGSVTTMLNDVFTWLPAVLRDDPFTSLKEVAFGAGPLPTATGGYWVDVRDLFMYGEQFVNFALTEVNASLVAVPTAGLEKRYVATADADALFVAASPANQIRQDGVVSLGILGSVEDRTQTV